LGIKIGLNVLILGPQGAGKGTQAKRISATYGIPHIATGDMFRAAIANASELGNKVAPLLASGTLVPDELTISLIRERLNEDDAADGFVLDGFPRNLAQAEALDAMFNETGRDFTVVLALQVSDAVATERLTKRSVLEGRADDRPEAITKRLATYHRETEPLIEYYRARDLLAPIDGDHPEDEVYIQIEHALASAEEHVR
jgi:adenylate kinase